MSDFEQLIKKNFTPFQALFKIVPESVFHKLHKVVLNSRFSDDTEAYKLFKKYGLKSIFDYFFYSSGLPRADFSFLSEKEEADFSLNIADRTLNPRESREPLLFGIAAYEKELITTYYYEAESEYLLLTANFRIIKDTTGDFFDYGTVSYYQLIAQEYKVEVLVILEVTTEFGLKTIILDIRPDSYQNIYRRARNKITLNNISSLIQSEESIPKIVKRLNPLFLVETELWPDDVWRLSYLEEIKNLIEHPDNAPEIVDTMRKLGISNRVILEFVVYPSGRPKTTMPFISNIKKLDSIGDYKVLPGDANPEQCWLISPELFDKHITLKKIYIPVVRFQGGMSRGLYFENTKEENIHGTYYYFESASQYFLKCRKIFISANKMTAFYILYQDKNKKNIKKQIVKIMEGSYENPEEVFDNMLNGDKNALEWNSTMYSKEDIIDKPLYNLAITRGYDAIVLTAMTGSTRIVTEVLDVRDRNKSFASLYQKPQITIAKSDSINK